jgi:P4 family phage/plasmid primase-like protien
MTAAMMPLERRSKAWKAAIDAMDGELTEDILAEQFIDALTLGAWEDAEEDPASVFRFVSSKWYEWDGKCWGEERTLRIFDRIRAFLRDKSDSKSQRRLGSAVTVAAVEELARSDRRCATLPEAFDSDPLLLNTGGGIVDLRTGTVRPHNPRALMSKISPARVGGPCSRWHEFLKQVTDGDDQLAAYLQRFAGYALTGSTCEHVLFFFHGSGGNGKGVLLGILAAVMGGYATVAPIEAFTESRGDRHPTELAMLQGARLVTAQETEQGRAWAESKIKSLTGGDLISARWMRGDFFTFKPQFKLAIAGNHRPVLKTVDEAIRRRLHLIPFTVTVPPSKRDPMLSQVLMTEAAGILEWMIEGCLHWQDGGLRPPARVLEATEDYFEAQDAFGQWFEDSCERAANGWELPGALFASWKAWADKTSEPVGTQRSFGDRLEAAGFLRARSNGIRMHRGLHLRDRHWQ